MELFRGKCGDLFQKKLEWSEEENTALIKAIEKHGVDWVLVSKELGSENGIVHGKHSRHCKAQAKILHEQGLIKRFNMPPRNQRDLRNALEEYSKARMRRLNGGHNPSKSRKILRSRKLLRLAQKLDAKHADIASN